jgi:hypothetical protein
LHEQLPELVRQLREVDRSSRAALDRFRPPQPTS